MFSGLMSRCRIRGSQLKWRYANNPWAVPRAILWRTSHLITDRGLVLCRASPSSLPVRALLKHRHMTEDDMCPWCGSNRETLSHAFFECAAVRDLWTEANCKKLVLTNYFSDLKNLIEAWGKENVKL